MDDIVLDIQGDPEVIAGVVALAGEHGIEVSAPMATESVSDALDAPIGVDEVRQVMEVVTLVASTGMTVVGFLAAVKALLKRSETPTEAEPKVIVIRTATQAEIAVIDKDTDLDDLKL